jgi:uncharacterized protein YecE (DUF72 family)
LTRLSTDDQPLARLKIWNARTPGGFVFSVKVPQTITHDKVLVDCDAEIAEFLETMDILGDKLGPIIFQFPFFSSAAVLGLRSFAYPCRTGEVDSAQDGRPGRQCRVV